MLHQFLYAHTTPTSSRLEPKYCFSHSKVQYTDFCLHLYTVTQTEESKSRRKAEHEDLLNVRNIPFKLTSVFSSVVFLLIFQFSGFMERLRMILPQA